MQKIGLFGGTFDPVHVSHVDIATIFANQLGLDMVVFIPTGVSYHKKNNIIASNQQRLEMLELAIGHDSRFAISDCDMVREGNTYTLDTLQIFRQSFASDKLWWLMGSDSLLKLHTWHKYQSLLKLCNFAIAPRGQDNLAKLPPETQNLVVDALNVDKSQLTGKIELLDLKPSTVNSGAIRDKIVARENVSGLLEPQVARYITEHHLYA